MNKNILILVFLIITSYLIILLINKETKITRSSQETISSYFKIDNNKDYVYDANYSYSNKYQEYKRPYSTENNNITINEGIEIKYNRINQYLKDLIVPYINIKSKDATNINNEIKNLYLKHAKQFDICANNIDIGGCTQVLTYKTYRYNNIISIVIIDGIQETSPMLLNYHTYNIDLSSGNILNFNDILSKLKLTKEYIISNIKNQIKEHLDNNYKSISNLNNCYYNDIIDSCYNLSNNLFEDSIKDNSILFFVNNEGNLNILPITVLNMENGTTTHHLFEINYNY